MKKCTTNGFAVMKDIKESIQKNLPDYAKKVMQEFVKFHVIGYPETSERMYVAGHFIESNLSTSISIFVRILSS
jgi:hypothetical protein